MLIITDETQNDKIYISKKHNEFIPVLVRFGGFRSSDAEGYVEALGINSAWGGIWDDEFDIKDANVKCKMLEFPFMKL